MGLYGPSIRVRGATSVPFPGYMLIGRGTNFAWSLTTPEVDIVDTYAERLCGGSRTRYRYKGRCRRMQTVRAGTIEKGGEQVSVRFRRTVHGPVTGYARVAGSRRVVALARKRSSYGRDTVDQIFFQRLTFGRVRSAADFVAAAKTTPQAFNAFYASDSEIAFYTTGRVPLHRRGVNPDLPVDGRGRHEWRGFLAGAAPSPVRQPAERAARQLEQQARPRLPRERQPLRPGRPGDACAPASARARAAAQAHARQRARRRERGRHRRPAHVPVADRLGCARRGEAPSPLAAAMVETLDRWAAGDGGWIDSDGDGKVDGAGQAVIDAVWSDLAGAALCGRLGRRLCGLLEDLNPRFDQPPASNQYGGWHNYMHKDLRALLGRPVAGRYRVSYCGNGSIAACASSLWRALDTAGSVEAARQGTSDPAQWRLATKQIAFTPLPLVDMQYTNRPSGIHQVMQFTP